MALNTFTVGYYSVIRTCFLNLLEGYRKSSKNVQGGGGLSSYDIWLSAASSEFIPAGLNQRRVDVGMIKMRKIRKDG